MLTHAPICRVTALPTYKQKEAVFLKKSGLTDQQIATKLEISREEVCRRRSRHRKAVKLLNEHLKEYIENA